jgi:hypothetical protein
MIKIDYRKDIAPTWASSIRAVKSVDELIALCKNYGHLTFDSLAIAEKMTDNDLIEFKEGLLSEARGVFAGEQWAEKYSHVFMPDKMVDITLIAERYKCPEGVVYHRLVDNKLI